MRIIEILDRDNQGRTQPFLCQADNGNLYFVKGHYAGYHSMACEWICGRLGQMLNLPIAPFEIVEVPRPLIQASLFPNAIELGAGEAFGSQKVEFAAEFVWQQVPTLDPGLMSRVLVFDWWIANIDRNLGELGGNANLLWANGHLHIIDHNNVFMESVLNQTWQEYCADHIFGQYWGNSLTPPMHLAGPWQTLEAAQAATLSTDNQQQCQEFADACRQSLDKLPDIWDELPEAWVDNLTLLSLQTVQEILGRGEGVLWEKP